MMEEEFIDRCGILQGFPDGFNLPDWFTVRNGFNQPSILNKEETK